MAAGHKFGTKMSCARPAAVNFWAAVMQHFSHRTETPARPIYNQHSSSPLGACCICGWGKSGASVASPSVHPFQISCRGAIISSVCVQADELTQPLDPLLVGARKHSNSTGVIAYLCGDESRAIGHCQRLLGFCFY